MTFRELAQRIQKMSEEQKNSDVSIYVNDEFYEIEDTIEEVQDVSLGDGILDEGHPFLILK